MSSTKLLSFLDKIVKDTGESRAIVSSVLIYEIYETLRGSN